MNNSHIDRAEILVQALPYIQKFRNKTIVIKYGGNAMITESLRDTLMTDIVLLTMVGIRVVLVHGGGPEISKMLERLGIESRFVNGLRYTDKDTAEVVQMVLAGKINKDLVSLINRHGGRALGLCGLDANLIKAQKHTSDGDIGFVGDIDKMDVSIINDALENGYIPVVSTVGTDGENVYNINADLAAARISAELKAEKLLLLTNVKGLLRDKDDDSTLITKVFLDDVQTLKDEGIVSEGMIPKIDCCVEAAENGVRRSHIIDGRIPHSVLIELLSDEGVGTMFCRKGE